jgi:hypothetical protein
MKSDDEDNDDGAAVANCNIICTRLSLCSTTGETLRHSYTALSYAWGNAENATKFILVDGDKRLPVGDNLAHALRHLCTEDKIMYLWVDAICINQNDLKERNHQVMQMKAIYSKAVETVVYLGPRTDSNTGDSAWNFLERNSEWIKSTNPSLYTAQNAKEYFRGGLEDVEIDILSRPWFQRVWVLQEVVVSTAVFIQCGRSKIAWDDFCKVVLTEPRFNGQYGWSFGDKNLYALVENMFKSRCAFQIKTGNQDRVPTWSPYGEASRDYDNSILATLTRARPLQATDPRDKIYALLGISAALDSKSDEIKIDYRKSYNQVYADFARSMIDTGSYDIFGYLTNRRVKSPWYPDWHMEKSTPVVHTALPLEDHARQQARRAEVQANHRWINYKRLPCCKGRLIGVVLSLGLHIGLTYNDELGFEKIREQMGNQGEQVNQVILDMWQQHWWKRGEPFHNLDNGAVSRSMKPDWFGLEKRIARNKPQAIALSLEVASASVALPDPVRSARRSSTNGRDHSVFLRDREEYPKAGSLHSGLPVLNWTDTTQLAPYSVEYHLIKRSHKSVTWDNSNNPYFTAGGLAVIVDKQSVVDQSYLGLYTEELSITQSWREKPVWIVSPSKPEPGSMRDAFERARPTILPRGTRTGDLIISLNGGRVPLVVREAEKPEEAKKLKYWRPGKRKNADMWCYIVGECIINGFERFDTPAPTDAGIEHTFNFL